jgi:cytoskeletal protein RodZ
MKPTMIVVSLLGFALAMGACHKNSTDTTPSATASESAQPAPSESAAAEEPSASASAADEGAGGAPPADSAQVPTTADYEQKAAQTAASQSLDTQVNALEKQIGGK